MAPQHFQRDGRQGDGSGTASRLRFLQFQTTPALLQRSPDRHHGSVSIDITPFKTKQFAASHAGGECKEHRKVQRRVLQKVKKSETLLLAEGHHLFRLGAWRRAAFTGLLASSCHLTPRSTKRCPAYGHDPS